MELPTVDIDWQKKMLAEKKAATEANNELERWRLEGIYMHELFTVGCKREDMMNEEIIRPLVKIAETLHRRQFSLYNHHPDIRAKWEAWGEKIKEIKKAMFIEDE